MGVCGWSAGAQVPRFFTDSRFTGDATDGTVHLGRPLRSDGAPRGVGQVLVRDSVLGTQISDTPWTDNGGSAWRDARFSEYRDSGPGAGAGNDRPQLTARQAAALTGSAYLSGSDHWQPWKLAG